MRSSKSVEPTAKNEEKTQLAQAKTKKYSYWDLVVGDLRTNIMDALAQAGISAQPLARSWFPLLEPMQELVNYLTAQVAKMSDSDHPNPKWKNFSKELIELINALKPVLIELSKPKLEVPQMIGLAHTLLEKLPQLLRELDKLKLDIRVGKMLDLKEQLKQDLPDAILKSLEQHLPEHYQTLKEELEKQYKNFKELDAIQDFSERSYIEKISVLIAMEEFNKGLESFFLALNRISIEQGIKEGTLLARPIFFDGALSINELCESFTRFYKKAIAQANVPQPPEESLYPYLQKIIFQQKELLEEHKISDRLTEDIKKVKNTALAAIKLLIEKDLNLAMLDDKNKSKKHLQNIVDLDQLTSILKGITEIGNNTDLDIVKAEAYAACSKTNPKFAMPAKLNNEIDKIITQTNASIKVLKQDAEYDQKYLEIRIKKSEDKFSVSRITSLIGKELQSVDPETEIHKYLTMFLQTFKSKVEVESQLLMSHLISEALDACKLQNKKFKLDEKLVGELQAIPNEINLKYAAGAEARKETKAKAKAEAEVKAKGKEEKQSDLVAVGTSSKYSVITGILTDIYKHSKETKQIIDIRSKDNRSANIILLVEKELKKAKLGTDKHNHLLLFLVTFKLAIKDTKKDMNKIIRETLAECVATDPAFALEAALRKEITDRHSFSAISKLETTLQYLYGQLEVMLDKNIYRQFILQIEGSGGDVKFQGNGWVKATGITLSKLKKALEKYKALSAFFSSENIEDLREIPPKEQFIIFAEKSRQLAISTKQLVQSYIDLEKDPFVKVLLTIPGLKEMILPNSTEINEIILDQASNPEAKAENEEEKEENEIILPNPVDVILEVKSENRLPAESKPIDPLEYVFNTASDMYRKTAENYAELGDARITETIEALARVKMLAAEYQNLKKIEQNKLTLGSFQVFGFLLNHTTSLFQLLNDLSKSADALYSVSKKEFSARASQLNLAVRAMVLLFNRIEIEFNLTPDYFIQQPLTGLLSKDIQKLLEINQLPYELDQVSLHDAITFLYNNLAKFNYNLSPKYPFTNDIIAQQKALRAKAANKTLKKEFLTYLIFQSNDKSKLDNYENRKAKETKNKLQIDHINTLIDANIAKLNIGLDANKVILQALLKKLTQHGTSLKTLETNLAKLAVNESDRENMYMLYQSHTKPLMQALQESSTTRKDLLNELELSIDKLSKKRTESYFFFAKSRRTALENILEAYNQLKKFLAHPGTKVTDFSLEQPYFFKLLLEHDKKLLENLLKLSEKSFYLKDEKLIAGDVYPFPEPTLQNAQEIRTYQDSLVADRIAELKSSWSITSTPAKKVKLLEKLAEHLQTSSLEKSLSAIRKDPRFASDFYLLHEGRTGKMIKKIGEVYKTKKDILHEIRLEITRLQRLRHGSFYFSEKSKKLQLENHIQACLELSKILKKSSQLNLTTALNALSPKYRILLIKHESELLDKLEHCQNAKREMRAARPRP
ncbi:MAG: hypothetical protein V4501_07840 [Pseudomonadota bacterium]